MTIQGDTFQVGQIAQAIGSSPQTIKAWLHKGWVMGHREISGGGGAGNRRRFSFHNLMEFATAKHLMEIGFQRDAGAAFKAAHVFAHMSDGITFENTRLPGFPYFAGKTFLCANSSDAVVVQHIPGVDALPVLMQSLAGPHAFLMLDAGNVFGSVLTALGYDPQSEIASAYGIEAQD